MNDLGWGLVFAVFFLILLMRAIYDNRRIRKKIDKLEEDNDRLIVALGKSTVAMKTSIQSIKRAEAVLDEHVHRGGPRPEDFDK